jgi:hypothetical protein
MDKKEGSVLYLPGHYGRPHFLDAIEYIHGCAPTHKIMLIRKLLYDAYRDGDVATANKILPVPLEEIRDYNRNLKWEDLTLHAKYKAISEGNTPKEDRYEVELEHLKVWDGADTSLYSFDLIGVYRSISRKNGEVGWDVTARRKKVGISTENAIKHFSLNIIIHQILHEQLVPTRTMLIQIFSWPMEILLLNCILLHNAKLKEIDYPSILLVAADHSIFQTVNHMISCGTIPNAVDRGKLARSIIICSKNTKSIEEGEQVSGEDGARDTLILFANKLEELGDINEAKRMRKSRVLTKEEIEARDQREKEVEIRKTKTHIEAIDLSEYGLDDV